MATYVATIEPNLVSFGEHLAYEMIIDDLIQHLKTQMVNIDPTFKINRTSKDLSSKIIVEIQGYHCQYYAEQFGKAMIGDCLRQNGVDESFAEYIL